MAKPFDSSTKQLVEMRPGDWLAFLGLPADSVEVMDADLASITTEADRVLRITEPVPYLAHFEFQAGHDDIVERTLRYNVLLWYRYKLPVQSVIFLLRRAAETNTTSSNGTYTVDAPDGSCLIEFRYRVVRVWEQNTEALLEGGLALLPFAPLSNVSTDALPGVVSRMQQRITAEAAPVEARDLWAATYLLMGLSYNEDFINSLLGGVRQMEESTTYQAILARGRKEGHEEGREEGRETGAVEGERHLLLLLGSKRLGEPSAPVAETLAAITSRERLEQLATRLLEVETWDELLAE